MLSVEEEETKPLTAPHAENNANTPEGVSGQLCGRLVFPFIVLVHAATGVLFFACQPGWSFLDAAYFIVLTVTTIGTGDVTPSTETQKVFTAFYVLVGFCLLGYFLGQVALLVTKRQEAQHRELLRQARTGASIDLRVSFFGRVTMAAHGMLFFLAVGTLFYSVAENWSSVDALYFSAVSLTTVGYGDLKVQSDFSRVFSTFYLLCGTLMTSFFLGSMAELFMDRPGQLIGMLYDSQTNQALWHDRMSRGSDVSHVDYMEYMLVNSGQVEEHTIQEIKHRYRQLHECGIVNRYLVTTE